MQEQPSQTHLAELVRVSEVLARTSARLAEQPDLSAFLSFISQEALLQLEAYASHLVLFDDQQDLLRTTLILEGDRVVAIAPIVAEMPAAKAGFHQLLSKSRKPRLFSMETEEHLFWSGSIEYLRQRNIKQVLVLPLLAAGHLLGYLGFAFMTDEQISDQKIELIQALARQTALAVQLTRLADEVKQAAILKVRNQMAREIHDTLAQSLGGVVVQLEAANYFMASQPSIAQQHMTTAQYLAQNGLAEARSAIKMLYQLDPPATDLIASLGELTNQLTRHTTLQTHLSHSGIPYLIPSHAGMNLLRMVQEAIQNCLRHANAHHLYINLTYTPQNLKLLVRDDGQGFSPEQAQRGFGLISMGQRADEIEAELIITSDNCGTTIAITLPIVVAKGGVE